MKFNTIGPPEKRVRLLGRIRSNPQKTSGIRILDAVMSGEVL
jgi:hypothetical protein